MLGTPVAIVNHIARLQEALEWCAGVSDGSARQDWVVASMRVRARAALLGLDDAFADRTSPTWAEHDAVDAAWARKKAEAETERLRLADAAEPTP